MTMLLRVAPPRRDHLPRPVDAVESIGHFLRAARTDHASDFASVLQEHQRRPQLDAERTAERLAAAVFHLDVKHARVRGERTLPQRLCTDAPAPRHAPELQ